MENKYFWAKWISWFILAVAIITVYKTFDNLHNVFGAFMHFIQLLKPFIIGFIFAFFLYPACKKLEGALKKTNKKWVVKNREKISILTVYFSFVAIFVVLLIVFMPKLSVSIADFLNRLPMYLEEISLYLTNMARNNNLLSSMNLEQLLQSISFQNMFDYLRLSDWGQYVRGVKGFTTVLISWFTGIVICAYTLLERDSLFHVIRRVFGIFMKEKTIDNIGFYIRQISNIFYQFFYGKAVESLIVGLIAIAGFSLLKVPFALLMGIIVMVFNMIPYFGSIIGAIPVLVITLIVTDVYKALWTLIFIVALQQFDGIVLGPKILGQSVGISPFWVIFAILVFGGLFGVWGMVIGVPVIATIRMLLLDYLEDRKLGAS